MDGPATKRWRFGESVEKDEGEVVEWREYFLALLAQTSLQRICKEYVGACLTLSW
jgi:hypothetical protein